jgi:hypothetical protein
VRAERTVVRTILLTRSARQAIAFYGPHAGFGL